MSPVPRVQVSGKLMDKERTLEEEIQLRERAQLQWKQAERTVDDLQMELQTSSQARDDLAKQLKQAQVHPSPNPLNWTDGRRTDTSVGTLLGFSTG